MIDITHGQLDHWIAQLFWPFARIGACFMVAPAFGATFVPRRVRLVIAGGVALVMGTLASSFYS